MPRHHGQQVIGAGQGMQKSRFGMAGMGEGRAGDRHPSRAVKQSVRTIPYLPHITAPAIRPGGR